MKWLVNRWIIAACGAVALVGVGGEFVGLALGQPVSRWALAVQGGSLAVWALYGVGIRFALHRQIAATERVRELACGLLEEDSGR